MFNRNAYTTIKSHPPNINIEQSPRLVLFGFKLNNGTKNKDTDFIQI